MNSSLTFQYEFSCDEPENGCRTRFETDYPALLQFQDQIERMMRERKGAAVLTGFNGNAR